MKIIVRTFFALWYLIGWVVHVYLGIWSPEAYNGFGNSALFPALQSIWFNLVIPNIRIFALLLAVIEIIIGLLLLYKGKWVKVGVAFSLLFNLFLVVLGLTVSAEAAFSDFVRNRLPNLVFMAGQLPLLWMQFDRSIPEVIREKLSAFRKRRETFVT